jgi:hypothetical protein
VNARLGLALMVGQQVLFAAETAAVHELGGSLSLMQIALVRGAGGLLRSRAGACAR